METYMIELDTLMKKINSDGEFTIILKSTASPMKNLLYIENDYPNKDHVIGNCIDNTMIVVHNKTYNDKTTMANVADIQQYVKLSQYSFARLGVMNAPNTSQDLLIIIIYKLAVNIKEINFISRNTTRFLTGMSYIYKDSRQTFEDDENIDMYIGTYFTKGIRAPSSQELYYTTPDSNKTTQADKRKTICDLEDFVLWLLDDCKSRARSSRVEWEGAGGGRTKRMVRADGMTMD